MTTSAISAEFLFESKYIEVHDSKMHYIDEGQGDPILFLHGNPTSSYLWRNIIPHVVDKGRCIALDLIGMGKSEKPKLDYTFDDHYKYLSAFVDQLQLDNLLLVLHDWGSGLGFNYAAHHPDKIRGIAFMESIIRPVHWSEFPPGFKMGFKLMRTPGIGWFMVQVMNAFVKQILPQATHRKLTQDEMDVYKAPYPSIRSRKPLRVWPCEIPIDGKPERMHKLVSNFSQKLQESEYPKLLLYAKPGGLITAPAVEWCKNHLKNLTAIYIGDGIHYIQEDHPDKIGDALSEWLDII